MARSRGRSPQTQPQADEPAAPEQLNPMVITTESVTVTTKYAELTADLIKLVKSYNGLLLEGDSITVRIGRKNIGNTDTQQALHIKIDSKEYKRE